MRGSIEEKGYSHRRKNITNNNMDARASINTALSSIRDRDSDHDRDQVAVDGNRLTVNRSSVNNCGR